MEAKKLLVGALAATALTMGGGAALAAGQAPETTADDTKQEEQGPSINGSVKAPGGTGQDEAAESQEGLDNEAAEAQQLQGLAKIDKAQAEEAALGAVSGTVKDAALGNENGSVIWEVEIAAEDGTLHEVKVDAGNGQILAQAADDEGSEQGEANEANEGPEGPEANESTETSGK